MADTKINDLAQEEDGENILNQLFLPHATGEMVLSLEGLLSDHSELDSLIETSLGNFASLDVFCALGPFEASFSEELLQFQDHVVVHAAVVDNAPESHESTLLQQMILLYGTG